MSSDPRPLKSKGHKEEEAQASITFNQLYKEIEEYQKKMGYDYSSMTEAQKMEALRNYNTALVVELGELLTEMPWKPWRTIKSQKRNKRKALLEYVDCIFFLVDMGLSMDFTAEEIIEAYKVKRNANLARIESGYSKIRKTTK